jgi:hypothetical protein
MNPTVIGALKSKTVWAGVLTAAVGVVNYAVPFIPPQYGALALAAAGLLQVALRTVTTQPLAQK